MSIFGKKWPRNKPATGQFVEFKWDGKWVGGTYDDREFLALPIWNLAVKLDWVKKHIPCSRAPKWREVKSV